MKLFTMNITGNMHQAAEVLNEHNLADYLVHFHRISAHNTLAVLRVPDNTYKQLKQVRNFKL